MLTSFSLKQNIDFSEKTVEREARLIPKIEEHLATFRVSDFFIQKPHFLALILFT